MTQSPQESKTFKHCSNSDHFSPSLRDQSIEPSFAFASATSGSLPECNRTDFPLVLTLQTRTWAVGRRVGVSSPLPQPPSVPQILSPQLQSLSSSRLIYFHYPVGADCKCRRAREGEERAQRERSGALPAIGKNAGSPRMHRLVLETERAKLQTLH